MIRYLVKVVNTANSKNKRYKEGTQSVYYYAADQLCVGSEGVLAEEFGTARDIDKYLVREYGYKSEASARRSWIYKHNDDETSYERFWDSAVSIVSCEC